MSLGSSALGLVTHGEHSCSELLSFLLGHVAVCLVNSKSPLWQLGSGRRYAHWWEPQALKGPTWSPLTPQRRELNLVTQLTVREVGKCSPAWCPEGLAHALICITGNPIFHASLPLALGKLGVGGRQELRSMREVWAVMSTPHPPSALAVFPSLLHLLPDSPSLHGPGSPKTQPPVLRALASSICPFNHRGKGSFLTQLISALSDLPFCHLSSSNPCETNSVLNSLSMKDLVEFIFLIGPRSKHMRRRGNGFLCITIFLQHISRATKYPCVFFFPHTEQNHFSPRETSEVPASFWIKLKVKNLRPDFGSSWFSNL